ALAYTGRRRAGVCLGARMQVVTRGAVELADRKPVRNRRQRCQPVPREYSPDEIIDAIANDRERNYLRPAEAREPGKGRIDFDRVQRGDELILRCAYLRDLPLPAFGRADRASFPLFFNELPLGVGKATQHRVSGILDRDRSVKVAEYPHTASS